MYRAALPFYLTAGDYTDAQTMHDNLPMVTGEDTFYAWQSQLAINLVSAGKTWLQLDTASIDTMMHIVQYNKAAGYMTGAINMLMGTGPVTWPTPVVDSAIMDSMLTTHSDYRHTAGNAGSSISPIVDVNNAGPSSFSVFPNPTYGNLTVSTSGAGRVNSPFIPCLGRNYNHIL
jgi:hypothetical protein